MATAEDTIYTRINQVLDQIKFTQDARIEAVLTPLVVQVQSAQDTITDTLASIDILNTSSTALAEAAQQAVNDATLSINNALAAITNALNTLAIDKSNALTELTAGLGTFNTSAAAALASLDTDKATKIAEMNAAVASLEMDKTAKLAEVDTALADFDTAKTAALADVATAITNAQAATSSANDAVTAVNNAIATMAATYAPIVHSHDFADLTSKPTTLAGFGITDAVSSSDLDALLGTPPATLDTIQELATALGNDPNFATTISTQVAGKVNTSDFTWANLGSKPATFAPDAHAHPISEVTGLQTVLDGKATTASVALKADQTVVDLKVNTSDFTWANLSGKPATFTATAHVHPISEVTDLQAALDDKASVASVTAKLDSANFTWANLSGKPATFPPDAHNHAISGVTGLQTALDAKADISSIGTMASRNVTISTADPSGGSDGDVWLKYTA